jgi:hypothetical protein
MKDFRMRLFMILVLGLLVGQPAGAQWTEPVQVSGQASMVSDLYSGSGIDRWPGATWRLNVTPRATLFGEVGVGFDILLSSTQSEFRQNVNQVGISPSWGWGTLHLGDFSRDYSRYLIRGTRLRGAGLELYRGPVALEFQAGRAERRVTLSEFGSGRTAFRRNLYAARVGIGSPSGTNVHLSLLRGRDDPGSVEDVIIVPDTLLLDTIPLDLRPPTDSRPQENLAVGMGGQLEVGERRLVLRGELASSLITRDLWAEEIGEELEELAIPSRLYSLVERLHDVRRSTGLDHAWEVEGTVNAGPGRFRAAYESVGPGFTSMGLQSFVNDRRGYRVDGAVRYLEGRLSLQGQLREQTNNIAGQLRNTVDRRTVSGSAILRPVDPVNVALSGVVSSVENDAAADSARLDSRALALNSSVGVQREVAGYPTIFSVGYGFQEAADRSPFAAVPTVTTHNVTGTVQVTVSPHLNLAPSVSGVTTAGEGIARQRNLFVGLRGNGRLLDGELRVTGNVSQSVNQGRRVFNSQVQSSYPIQWGMDLRLQARHNRFSAFGEQPGFRESFLTLALSRGF